MKFKSFIFLLATSTMFSLNAVTITNLTSKIITIIYRTNKWFNFTFPSPFGIGKKTSVDIGEVSLVQIQYGNEIKEYKDLELIKEIICYECENGKIEWEVTQRGKLKQD